MEQECEQHFKMFAFLHIIEVVVAQGHKKMTVTQRLWVLCPHEGMNYYVLKFSLLRSGTKTPGVELRQSTRNASKNSRTRNVVTLGFLPVKLPAVCRIQREALLIIRTFVCYKKNIWKRKVRVYSGAVS